MRVILTGSVCPLLIAHVNFDAEAGVTYRIAVAGYDTNGVGNFRLRVAPGRRPDTNGPVASIISPASESLFTTSPVALAGTAKDPRLDDTGVSQVLLQVNAVNADPPVALSGMWTDPQPANQPRRFYRALAP